jgi:hypothetical protein
MAVPLVGKAGNATWLVLTAAVRRSQTLDVSFEADVKILLLIATVLYGIKACRKPKTESDFHEDRTKDIEMDQAPRY